MSLKKICLAYSGGLDTSIIIPWLKEQYPGAEVVAWCADVGQGSQELEGLVEKGLASGACKVIIDDLRQELVEEVIWPALKAGAVYERTYLLGTALARPVTARGQVRAALAEGCDAISHGCTGKGNDQVRFEHAYQALAPQLTIVAPWRHWDIKSREDAIDYADAHHIDVRQSKAKIYSRDANLWHISHEGGELEDPGVAVPDHVWTWTTDPGQAPDEADELTLHFEQGVPVAVDGQPRAGVELMDLLNHRAAKAGVGRIDLVENRLVGMKSRGAYETPGGTVLLAAHRALEEICLDRASMRLKDRCAIDYADLLYDGLWFSPAREALDALATRIQQPMSGTVGVSLCKGRCTVLTRTAAGSLYDESLSTFAEGEGYDQADAGGFIQLHGLGTARAYQRDRNLHQASQPHAEPPKTSAAATS